MRDSLFEESPFSALFGQLRRLTMDICQQIAAQSHGPKACNVAAVLETSQCLVSLSAFAGSKRLQPFCIQFAGCCALLGSVKQHGASDYSLLLKAGLLLEASLSDPEEGVQEDCLSVSVFDQLRDRKKGKSSSPEKVLSLTIPAPRKAICRSFRIASEKLLLTTFVTLDESTAQGKQEQIALLILCFENFSNTPLEPSWESKSSLLKLLFIEQANAHVELFDKNIDSASKALSLERLIYHSASQRALRLIHKKLYSLSVAIEKFDARFMNVSEQALAQALLVAQLLVGSIDADLLLQRVRLARSYTRRLRCWPQHLVEGSYLLRLCLLSIVHATTALLVPRGCKDLVAFNALKMRRRCELVLRRIYKQYPINVPQEKALAQGLQEVARSEIAVLQKMSSDYLFRVRQYKSSVYVEPEMFWALIRLQALAFCVRNFSLYECAFSAQNLYSLGVERQLLLRPKFLDVLPKLFQIAAEQEREKKHTLCEQVVSMLAQEELVSKQCFAATSEASSDKLANFLSTNIHELVIYPELLKGKRQAIRVRVSESRRCLLELNMLSVGARTLNVDRVADLSEVLEEVHSALCALPDLSCVDLPALLGPAHQLLRENLNSAAARQTIEDNRAVVAELYLFLEKNLPLVAPKWRRRGLRQRTKQLVNHLDSNLGTVEALMKTQALAHVRTSQPLFARLLLEQRSFLQQLQEELNEAQLVRFVRVRARLQRFVARQAHDTGRQVRLHIRNENLQFKREVIASLMAPLQKVLQLIIEQGLEDEAIRRLRQKPKACVISMQVQQLKTGIQVDLSDDGQEIEQRDINALRPILECIGGALTHEYLPLQGNRIKVVLTCASARWDIAR